MSFSLVRAALRPVARARVLSFPSLAKQQHRNLYLHEYQGVEIFNEFGVGAPRGRAASTPEEAAAIAQELGTGDYVVKAQVLAGGRGLGIFTSGFKGGVHPCTTPEEVKDIAAKMLGFNLRTKQTSADGQLCSKVLVCERLYLRREMYFAIVLDREHGGPVIVASQKGGVDIESVAAESPEFIIKEPIDVKTGLLPEQAQSIAESLGFSKPEQIEDCVKTITGLYNVFTQRDCTQVEINPLAETNTGRVLCMDAKLNFDDNAEFRQKETFGKRDHSQEDPQERIAEESNLNYIALDGSIGCMVNGAGLAMATMDIIQLHGGSPANFLDVGGGATETQVVEAFKILNADPKVRAILVNIFGGIMRCDVIAGGIVEAAKRINLRVPLVVRLKGTKVEEAKAIFEQSGMRIIVTDDLDDAAQKSVRLAQIVDLAQGVSIKVSFEIPL